MPALMMARTGGSAGMIFDNNKIFGVWQNGNATLVIKNRVKTPAFKLSAKAGYKI